MKVCDAIFFKSTIFSESDCLDFPYWVAIDLRSSPGNMWSLFYANICFLAGFEIFGCTPGAVYNLPLLCGVSIDQ